MGPHASQRKLPYTLTVPHGGALLVRGSSRVSAFLHLVPRPSA
jgi:hypothetical protein